MPQTFNGTANNLQASAAQTGAAGTDGQVGSSAILQTRASFAVATDMGVITLVDGCVCCNPNSCGDPSGCCSILVANYSQLTLTVDSTCLCTEPAVFTLFVGVIECFFTNGGTISPNLLITYALGCTNQIGSFYIGSSLVGGVYGYSYYWELVCNPVQFPDYSGVMLILFLAGIIFSGYFQMTYIIPFVPNGAYDCNPADIEFTYQPGISGPWYFYANFDTTGYTVDVAGCYLTLVNTVTP